MLAPKSVQALNERAIGRFRSNLLRQTVGQAKKPLSHATVNRHLRTLRAALSWARKRGLLHRVPYVEMLPNANTRAKGRPITEPEFNRMLAATELVVDGADAQLKWKRFLRALWTSGLRLSEALQLRWGEGPVHVDTRGDRPMMQFDAQAQKNRQRQTVPITPDFWQVLSETPASERTGLVFDVYAGQVTIGKRSYAVNCRRVETIGRVITEIGRIAAVRVSESGKPASAHDLRRSFGERWSKQVVPTVLMRLMRHANIQTTMAFYATGEADSISDVVWKRDDAGSTDTFTDTTGSGDR